MKLKRFLPAVAGVFTFAVIALGGLYLNLLYPRLAVPSWLYPLVLVSALESAYYASFYLNSRTPMMVRIIELAIWLIPAYFFAGRVLNDFLWPALLIFTSWLMARGFGSQFVKMERVADQLGDQAASTVSWEYESLASKKYDSLPMEYFWWRFFGTGLVLVILAILVHRHNLAILGSTGFKLRLFGSLAVASGLTLQAGAYLFRLQVLWSCAKAKVNPELTRSWFLNLGVVLLLLLLVVNFAPVNYSPITADRLGELFNNLIEHDLKMPMPFTEQSPQTSPQPHAEEMPKYSEEMGLGAIVYGIFILLMVAGSALIILLALGLVLASLLKTELERLKGLPKLAVQIYLGLRDAIREFLSAIRKLKSTLVLQKSASKESQRLVMKNKIEKIQPDPKGVRAMFRRIARTAAKKGVVLHPAQTAREYSQNLNENLLGSQDSVSEFVCGYHQVRYSNRELSSSEQKRLLMVGTKIIEEIKVVKKGD